MLLVAPVLDRASPAPSARRRGSDAPGPRSHAPGQHCPAAPFRPITHVDYSARVQTIDERHGRFHRLMKKFHEKTGCPIIVNTSFNLSWEPIVRTPQEAYHTFMQSEMDVLVSRTSYCTRSEQPVRVKMWVEPAKNGKPATPDPDSPWADPMTGEPLVMTCDEAVNPASGTRYPVEEGIPRLFVPTEGRRPVRTSRRSSRSSMSRRRFPITTTWTTTARFSRRLAAGCSPGC